MQFVLSWKDPKYQKRWVTSLQKGYDQFLNDLETYGSDYFIKIHQEDKSLTGITGSLYWQAVRGFLKHIRYEGFLKLFYKITKMEKMLRVEDLISHLKSYPSLENLDHTLFPKAWRK